MKRSSRWQHPTGASRLLIALGFAIGLLTMPTRASDDYLVSWSFDEGVGSIAHDDSTNASDGIIHGASWVAGVTGFALDLDGEDDYVELTDGDGPPNAIGQLTKGSISIWFRIDRMPDEGEIFPMFYLGDGISGPANSSLIIEIGHFGSDTRVYFTLMTGSGLPVQCYDSRVNLELDRWHLFTAIVGEDFNTGFLNGLEMHDRDYNFGDASSHFFFADVPNQQACWIGDGFLATRTEHEFADLTIDEVRIYDRPLSRSEVEAYYESIIGPRSALLPYELADDSSLLGDALPGTVVVEGRYSDHCMTCHGPFDGPISPKLTEFPFSSKHEMHRNLDAMGTNCDLCHTTGDDFDPFLGSSNGTSDTPGLGCLGCHGRDYGGSIGHRAAGLRAHHANYGVVVCTTCHEDDPTPLPESVLPAYYGSPDTFVGDPCNTGPGFLESWTLGDTEGLDNDGDDLYDAEDTDCGCSADLDGSGTVDVQDLLGLVTAWGTDPGGPPDFDGDGLVEVDDLLELVGAWGACP